VQVPQPRQERVRPLEQGPGQRLVLVLPRMASRQRELWGPQPAHTGQGPDSKRPADSI